MVPPYLRPTNLFLWSYPGQTLSTKGPAPRDPYDWQLPGGCHLSTLIAVHRGWEARILRYRNHIGGPCLVWQHSIVDPYKTVRDSYQPLPTMNQATWIIILNHQEPLFETIGSQYEAWLPNIHSIHRLTVAAMACGPMWVVVVVGCGRRQPWLAHSRKPPEDSGTSRASWKPTSWCRCLQGVAQICSKKWFPRQGRQAPRRLSKKTKHHHNLILSQAPNQTTGAWGGWMWRKGSWCQVRSWMKKEEKSGLMRRLCYSTTGRSHKFCSREIGFRPNPGTIEGLRFHSTGKRILVGFGSFRSCLMVDHDRSWCSDQDVVGACSCWFQVSAVAPAGKPPMVS